MVKETEYYDILGVKPDATDDQIRKGYLKMAKKYHPDKNKDNPEATEIFKAVGEAYEVLSNPQKRARYDRGGKEGLSDAGPVPDRSDRKCKPLVRHLRCTLEDLYNGKTQKFNVTRQTICSQCRGHGTLHPENMQVCDGCDGHGIRIVLRRIGLSFVQQSREVCTECGGRGQVFAEEDQCPYCEGQTVISEIHPLEVFVEPGTSDGKKITLMGEGDEEPDAERGDVQVIVDEQPDLIFRRKGDDLHMEKTLTLGEALCGFTFPVTTLSQERRILHISSAAGEVIKPNDTRIVYNEGMPVYRNSLARGNLIIHFNIEYPQPGELTPQQLRALRVIFAHPPPMQEEAHHEVVTLQEPSSSSSSSEGYQQGYGREEMDEDEEDEDGYGQAQTGPVCIQQ